MIQCSPASYLKESVLFSQAHCALAVQRTCSKEELLLIRRTGDGKLPSRQRTRCRATRIVVEAKRKPQARINML
jgi:hypothetical protein